MEFFDLWHRRIKHGMRLVSDLSPRLMDNTTKDSCAKNFLDLPFKIFEMMITSIRKKVLN